MTKVQKRLLAAYKWWSETVEGKLILDDLRELYQDRLSYVKGDPYQTAYHEGGRALYLRIMSCIEQAKELERVSYGRSKQRVESRNAIESDSDESTDDGAEQLD